MDSSNAILTVLAIAGAVWFFSTQQKEKEKAPPHETAREFDLFDDGRFDDGFPFND
jgi:hypothetical protein